MHDDPHGIYVVDLVERLVLDIHLLVNAEYRLYSALDNRFGFYITDTLSDTLYYRIDKAVALLLVNVEQPLYLLAAVWVKVVNGNAFHFLLDVAHTSSVGDRRVEVHSFKRGLALLLGRT